MILPIIFFCPLYFSIVFFYKGKRIFYKGVFLNRIFPQTVYCWGSILERKELATLTGRAPELCGWALWLGSVAGLCGWALSSSCPPLGRAPELCQPCGWALWLGLVLLLAAPLNSVNSVAGLARVLWTARSRSEIRSRKARSGRALQRERQRKRNLKIK